MATNGKEFYWPGSEMTSDQIDWAQGNPSYPEEKCGYYKLKGDHYKFVSASCSDNHTPLCVVPMVE